MKKDERKTGTSGQSGTTRAGWTVSSVVEAPIEKVWKVPLDTHPGLPLCNVRLPLEMTLSP